MIQRRYYPIPKTQDCHSILPNIISGYICEKKAVGYNFIKGAKMLKGFDKFFQNWDLKDISLPKEPVEEWTKRTPNESISNQCGRISILRGLAEYMSRLGFSAYVYPRALVSVDRYSYVPYISLKKRWGQY